MLGDSAGDQLEPQLMNLEQLQQPALRSGAPLRAVAHETVGLPGNIISRHQRAGVTALMFDGRRQQAVVIEVLETVDRGHQRAGIGHHPAQPALSRLSSGKPLGPQVTIDDLHLLVAARRASPRVAPLTQKFRYEDTGQGLCEPCAELGLACTLGAKNG